MFELGKLSDDSKLKYENLKSDLEKETKHSEDLQNQNDDLNKKLSVKFEETTNLERDLREAQLANRSHLQTIETRDAKISEQEQEIEENKKQKLELNTEREQLQQEIASLKNDKEVKEKNYETTLLAKDRRINELENINRTNENTITSQTNVINSKNEEIRKLTDENKMLSNNLVEIKKLLNGNVNYPIVEEQNEKTL